MLCRVFNRERKMTFSERFWTGVYMANNSFGLLWQHPRLFVYLGGAALVYFFAQLVSYNMPIVGFAGDEVTMFIGMQGWQYRLIEFTHWIYQGLFFILTYFYVFVITFLHVCLIRHTLAILYQDPDRARIYMVLKRVRPALGRIAIWSLVFTLVSLLLRVIAVSTYYSRTTFSVGLILVIFLVISWSLTTFFVLQILAVHQVSIIKAIKTSICMVKSLLVEILGAEVWMGIIIILCFVPISIISRVLGLNTTSFGLFILSLMMTLATVLISYVILSAQTVLKTKLYYYFVEPLQELAFLQYPQF